MVAMLCHAPHYHLCVFQERILDCSYLAKLCGFGSRIGDIDYLHQEYPSKFISSRGSICLGSNTTKPCASFLSFGTIMINSFLSMTVLTPYQPSSESGLTVGLFSAGSSFSSLGRFSFFTLTNIWSFFLPSTTPRSSAIMSAIFSRFAGSLRAFLFAISTAVDSATLSIIFKLFWASVVPVSVISKIASTSSGGLASVAPKERNISTFLFSPTLSHGVIIIGSALPYAFL